MSELAFNANGESFEIPATVSGWRVRRMKPRGAPELVYGRDGRPLTIPIEADIDDLREAVGTPAKYRLDAINDDGKIVENVPPAYVHVIRPERNASTETPHPASALPEDTSTVREAMRLNAEMSKSVIDQFSSMMAAAADLIRAADGAGIPARAPRPSDDRDDDEDGDAPAARPAFDLHALVAQVVPMIVMALSNKGAKQKLAELVDWRKATPAQVTGPAAPTAPSTASDRADDAALPPIDPQMMTHFLAIQSALTASEAALAREVAADLSPTELRAWIEDLGTRSVPDAATKIRTLINGGAS